jgi:hypothetical protein
MSLELRKHHHWPPPKDPTPGDSRCWLPLREILLPHHWSPMPPHVFTYVLFFLSSSSLQLTPHSLPPHGLRPLLSSTPAGERRSMVGVVPLVEAAPYSWYHASLASFHDEPQHSSASKLLSRRIALASSPATQGVLCLAQMRATRPPPTSPGRPQLFSTAAKFQPVVGVELHHPCFVLRRGERRGRVWSAPYSCGAAFSDEAWQLQLISAVPKFQPMARPCGGDRASPPLVSSSVRQAVVSGKKMERGTINFQFLDVHIQTWIGFLSPSNSI